MKPRVSAPAPVPANQVSQRGLSRVGSISEEQTVQPVRTGDLLCERYRLEEKIGEGGMGTVYIAQDVELDRHVAVKMLASALVNDREVVERFVREARLTAKLDHPNIVPIFDVGTHYGRPFIVMKLLKGSTLADVLRNRGGFSSDEIVKLMRQLAAGLSYIHDKGFIHRDIKAGNILIADDGHATILDFGILRSRSATQGLTRAGMVMGTPHYMAPEQAMGLKDVDHRVDLYALAVVLFECLTGTLPFEADSELRLIQMQAHAPPPDILDRAPWIAKPVAEVMAKALAKKPEDRFATATELVDALERAYRDTGGHPAAPLVSPPLKLTATATPLVNTRTMSRGTDGPLGEETRQLVSAVRPKRTGLYAASALLLIGLIAGGTWALLQQRQPHDGGQRGLAINDAAADASLGSGTAAVNTGTPDAALAIATVDDADAGDDTEDDDDAGVEVDTVAGSERRDAGPRRHVVRDPPTKPRRGRLNVLTTRNAEPYWASVSVDGSPRGRTPLLLDLQPGRHTIRIERAGFRTQEREIRIASGKSVVVRIELTP